MFPSKQHSWSKAYWTKDQQPPHIFFKMVLSFTEKSNIFLRLSGNINMKKCLLFSAQVTGFGQESSIPISRSANVCTHGACVVRLYLAFSWKPGAWWLDLTSGAKSAGIWSTEDFSAPSAKGGDSGWHVHWEEAVITAALWWLHTAAPFCVLLSGPSRNPQLNNLSSRMDQQDKGSPGWGQQEKNKIYGKMTERLFYRSQMESRRR